MECCAAALALEVRLADHQIASWLQQSMQRVQLIRFQLNGFPSSCKVSRPLMHCDATSSVELNSLSPWLSQSTDASSPSSGPNSGREFSRMFCLLRIGQRFLSFPPQLTSSTPNQIPRYSSCNCGLVEHAMFDYGKHYRFGTLGTARLGHWK